MWGCRPVAPTNGVASPKKVGPAHNFSLLVSIIKGHNILYIHGAQLILLRADPGIYRGGGGQVLQSEVEGEARIDGAKPESKAQRLRIEGEALCICMAVY